ncbi:hypothetical protein IR114_09150, partial [Granulicatella sp. 19428wC4_WM01]
KTVEVPVTVQRDTDGDGIPDVTDPDDDNDGFTDEEEKAKGTDSKDPNSKPSTQTDADRITPTVPEKTPVKDVTNLTDEERKAVEDKIKEVNKDKFPPGT